MTPRGTHFNNYQLCRRKLWLFVNGINVEHTADWKASVALYARDGRKWLNQQQMAELFATSKQLISHHIANILKGNELTELSVVKQYLTTGQLFRIT